MYRTARATATLGSAIMSEGRKRSATRHTGDPIAGGRDDAIAESTLVQSIEDAVQAAHAPEEAGA